jgi:hypothetical protein
LQNSAFKKWRFYAISHTVTLGKNGTETPFSEKKIVGSSFSATATCTDAAGDASNLKIKGTTGAEKFSASRDMTGKDASGATTAMQVTVSGNYVGECKPGQITGDGGKDGG